MTRLLRIDASARREGSGTRRLGDQLVERLLALDTPLEIKHRDLLATPPRLPQDGWVKAHFTPETNRSDEQNTLLVDANALIEELFWADIISIGAPIYNFGMPGALKAWFDLICRPRTTFQYGENGPEGLLTDKRAVLLVSSGGTGVGSDVDFATEHLKFLLGFLGISFSGLVAVGGPGDAEVRKAAADAELARIVYRASSLGRNGPQPGLGEIRRK